MYTFLLDEAEGVIVARLGAGASSAELASGALRAIAALDRAACHHPFPRVTLAILDDDSEHFGPDDRARVMQANASVRHPTLRLMVTRSRLQLASLSVVQQLGGGGANTTWRTFGTVDQALAASAHERPGLHRVVRRLLAVLDESMQSAVLKSAKPASWSPDARRQVT